MPVTYYMLVIIRVCPFLGVRSGLGREWGKRVCRKLGYLGAKEGGSQEAVWEACLEEGGLSWALQVG